MRKWTRQEQREWERLWGPLATYNSEVARGIVHTPEYDAKMDERQKGRKSTTDICTRKRIRKGTFTHMKH